MSNIYELLKAPLPKEAVKQHPTKTYLSSIKAIYVTERFNDVFGIGAWSIKVSEVSCNESTGMVVVKVTFEVLEHSIYYESYGGNDNGGAGSKNFDLGDAYKGATTDAITKIGSYMGVAIDVFKGLSKANSSSKEKQWLNIGSIDWANAVKKRVPLKEVMGFYSVSKANQEQYLKEISQ